MATLSRRENTEPHPVEEQMVDKILITGASGLLGQSLVKLAGVKGHEVCSLYHTHPPRSGRTLQIDLTDAKAVEDLLQMEAPNVVINTASITDVDLCEREPELAMRVNGTAAGYLAEACERIQAFLVHVSTDYVFDGIKGNYSENDETAPVNCYGSSKLLGERLTLGRGKSCIARTSVLYGWGRQNRANFATWLHGKLSRREQVNVVTDQFASPTLNSSLAEMILELSGRRLSGIFHVSGATRASRYGFAIALAQQFGFDTNLVIPVESSSVGWVARRPRDSSLNVAKAMEILDNKPATMDAGLRKFAQEAPKT